MSTNGTQQPANVAHCTSCGSPATDLIGEPDGTQECVRCAHTRARADAATAEFVCTTIAASIREALGGLVHPDDLRHTLETCISEKAGHHPPYNGFVDTIDSLNDRAHELSGRAIAQDTSAMEARALLIELAADHRHLIDLSPDASAKLRAWATAHAGEDLQAVAS